MGTEYKQLISALRNIEFKRLSWITSTVVYILVGLGMYVPFDVSAQQAPNGDEIGSLIAAGGRSARYNDQHFIISTVVEGEPAYKIPNTHTETPYYFTLSDDGRYLIYSIKTKEQKITYIHDLNSKGALVQTLPFAIESTAFNSHVCKAFFVHSKTFWGARLTAFDTKGWHKLAERYITDLTNSIAVDADGSQLLAAAKSVVRVIDAETLNTEKVNWETSRLKKLVYDPTNNRYYASVNHKNVIEVRDLLKDRVVHTIRGGKGQIEQLAYGLENQLVSLDDLGNLNVWDLHNKKRQLAKSNVRAFNQLGNGRLSFLTEKWEFSNHGKEASLGIPPDSAFMSRRTGNVGIAPIPIIAYGPETSLVLGLGMSFIFAPPMDSTATDSHFFRPSSLTPSLSYGFKGQLQATLSSAYFSKKGWYLSNRVDYLMNNRSQFFGLGNDVRQDVSALYHNHIFSWEGALTKTIGHRFSAGITALIRHDSPLDFEASGLLALPEDKGGFTVGIGPMLRFDTRNDVIFPTNGHYLDISFTRFGGWIGSDYEYSDLKIDYRGYHSLPILTEGTTLAVQAQYHGAFNGDVPFYQLPYLSADRLLRGVWRNLYIDRQAFAVQGELRSSFTDIDPRFGYVLFAGVGDVATNFLKAYDPRLIGVFGLGVRKQLVPKLKLQSRIDCSINTRGDIGVFGGVGVAF